MKKEIEEVKKFYNLDCNIKRYSDCIDKVGLWESEKIFYSKYISKTNKILDLGCGAGRTTINLYKADYKNIIGLDLSDQLIKCAKEYCDFNNLKIPFVVGDATQLNYENNSFDAVIFSHNGIQCIPKKNNRDLVLKEVFRVLKPNGVFIFTAHNREATGRFEKKWKDEAKKWEMGKQDKNLEIFGDQFLDDGAGNKAFIHFSNIAEMESFIKQENFEILKYAQSGDVAKEKPEVNLYIGAETVFGVCKKIN